MRRKFHLLHWLLLMGVLGACNTEPLLPIPTLAVLPTHPDADVAAAPEATATDIPASATPTLSPTPTTPPPTLTMTPLPPTWTPLFGRRDAATAAPTLSAPTAQAAALSADAMRLDAVIAKVENRRRINFSIWLTPMTQLVQSATLRYTYPSTGATEEKRVPLPPQTLGETLKNPISHTMGIDQMPLHEDRILYQWVLEGQDGSQLVSPQQTFKVTEAITEERRDDLPIIPAEASFVSDFPRQALLSVRLTPESPIRQAKVYYTQNTGLVLFSFNVRVPQKRAGEEVEITFTFNDQLALQIPWQKLEWWFMLTDQNGKQWRTQPQFNEYSDTRFHRWTRTEGRRSVVFTYERSTADIDFIVNGTDHAIERLEKMFGYRLLYTPHIVFYNEARHFRAWAPAQLADIFIGLASGVWGGAVVTFYDSLDYTVYAVIQHELTHLFQYQSMRNDDVPRWWVEGTARHFEERNDEDQLLLAKNYVRRRGMPDLTRTNRHLVDTNIGVTYYVGASVMQFFIETYGIEAFQRVHIATARHIPFDQALQNAIGKTRRQLSQEFEAWLRR